MIGLNIGGEPGSIAATTVRDSLDDLIVLVNAASREVGAGRQDWTIENLAISSAVFAVGAPDEGPIAALLRSGFDALARRAEIPAGWTRTMVERVSRLGQRVGRGGATGVEVTGLGAVGIEITAETTTNAERALGVAAISYGSVRGTVDRWNEHDRREVKVTLDDDTSVTVKYPAALSERIRAEALGRKIEAWGTVSRDSRDNIVELRVEDFELLPELRSVPTSEVAGIFANEDGTPWFTVDEWLAARGG